MNEPSTQTSATWIETSAGVRARPDLCVVDVQGEDQRTWLNGQISNDVRSTQRGDAVYALVLNIRGKILSDLWVIDRGDGMSLIMPATKHEQLREHLEQYIIMEDVELQLRPDAVVVSVQGPRARDVVTRVELEGYPCDELGLAGQYVVTTDADVDATMRNLLGAAAELGGGAVTEAGFELVRVRRGVPRFGVDFDESNYPQEAGLKQRAVSFSKGCYLGQEVVCTLESRGKLSRKLVVLSGRDLALHVGDAIVTQTGEDTGKLTSLVFDGESAHALGYVRRIHIDQHSELRAGGESTLTIDRVVGES